MYRWMMNEKKPNVGQEKSEKFSELLYLLLKYLNFQCFFNNLFCFGFLFPLWSAQIKLNQYLPYCWPSLNTTWINNLLKSPVCHYFMTHVIIHIGFVCCLRTLSQIQTTKQKQTTRTNENKKHEKVGCKVNPVIVLSRSDVCKLHNLELC